LKTVEAILAGEVETKKQSQFLNTNTELKPAPKIFKDTCRINWKQDARMVYNFIRGLSTYPCAWSELHAAGNEQYLPVPVKILAATYTYESANPQPGTLETDNKTFLRVACLDGYIYIKQLQMPSKKILNTEDLLRGYTFKKDSYFE